MPGTSKSAKPQKPAHITQEDWDAVALPEMSDEFLAGFRPVAEVAPELVEMQRRRGRPPVAAPKVPVQIRLSPEVVEFFKEDGAGWQTRIDAALRAMVKRAKRGAARKRA